MLKLKKMISDEQYKEMTKNINSEIIKRMYRERDCINAAKAGDFQLCFYAHNYPTIHLEKYITDAQWDIIKKMILENLDIKIPRVKKLLESV